MSLIAPDPRPSLSLTESNLPGAIALQQTASRKSRGDAQEDADDAAQAHIPEPVGSRTPEDAPRASSSGSSSRPSSRRPADIETSWQAWLCVLASFLFLAPSYGFMQSIGTVQSYLTRNQLAGYSDSEVGWITGLYTFLALFFGIQTGPLVDVYGPRLVAPLATLFTVPMFFLLAECTQFWHFALCLGVLGGAGGALCATLAVALVGKLFVRLRGLAMGIALAGSSSGGIIFPLMLREVLPRWGFAWSFRAAGFVVLGMTVCGTLCTLPFDRLVASTGDAGVVVAARSEPASDAEEGNAAASSTRPPTPRRSVGVNFSAFRSPPFSLVTGCFFLLEFVIFGITGMLPSMVVWAGFPPEAGYSMIAILNGASCLGRVLPGLAGDRWGHFNVLLAMMLATLLATAATILPFGSTSITALYVFSGLWGFGSGSFLSLTPVCMGKTCEAKDYGRYYGTMNFCVSWALLVTIPIGGKMLEAMGSQALVGLYLGVLCLGGGSAFAARALLVGTWFDLKARV